MQLRAGKRKGFQDAQRAGDPAPNVCRQIEHSGRLLHIPPRLRGDDDLCHSGSQLVERRSLATSCLGEALLRPLPSTWDRIQDLSDSRRIGVCVVKSRRKQRAGERPLLDVGSLGKFRKLARPLFIQGHIDAFCWRRH